VFSSRRRHTRSKRDWSSDVCSSDLIIIGTPVFQASIPAALKNIFDLLPQNALRDMVVSLFVTAGSSKHYLMIEHQLMPILTYMKAHIVPTYVFKIGRAHV